MILLAYFIALKDIKIKGKNQNLLPYITKCFAFLFNGIREGSAYPQTL